jgi:hypothetical protein
MTLCGLFAFQPTPRAAEDNPSKPAAKKDAQALIIQMQLKRWTKEVGLTDQQQKQIQALLEDEAKRTAKLAEDTSLSVPERSAKYAEIKKETRSKITPLLTADQLEKWEKATSRPANK